MTADRPSDRTRDPQPSKPMDAGQPMDADDREGRADNTTARDTSRYPTLAGQQCRARSKRSGQRCKRHAPAGGVVCSMHGGKSPRAKLGQERRLAVHEAHVLFADRYEPREWDEALRAAGQVMDQVTRYLTDKIELAEYPSPGDLDALLQAAEKTARMAKLIQDSGLDSRRQELAEAQATLVAGAMQAVLSDLGHNIADAHVQRVLSERLAPLSTGAQS